MELHDQKLQDASSLQIQQGQYNAVEYHKSYYIGRVLKCNDGAPVIEFKFLYSVGAKVFDWPKRDDIDYCDPLGYYMAHW